jgi:soluble cytochrome b562
MEKGMKKLKKSLKVADENAASAATVAEIKKASEACIDLIPAYAAKVPEAKRAAFIEDYKKEMKEFIAELDKLADAIKANKNDEAIAIHKKLGDLEDKGHEKFTPDN